ncbi:uncharacterized protein LAJ45_02565 [Morchella importuna]|uniref:uncharacterized protein n=1 Tax=Morchella importuna TaxID=1174673 RepID=UPI001E8DFBBE|nr:uncharacterized protein LAJ45_02565 [Morchella importuna]KAH8153752.1 hypothetical protein LAJ45_02565 [Morchella importuna]
MSVKTSIPIKQVINLISSSPPHRVPSPSNDLVSSPLSSPSSKLKQFSMTGASSKVGIAQSPDKGRTEGEEPSVWDVSNDAVEDQGKASPPTLPPARKKRAVKATEDPPASKKSRTPHKTRDNSKVERKKRPLKDGKLKARVVKSATGPSKSKYFAEQQEGELSISGPSVNDSSPFLDNPALQDVYSKQSTPTQESPSQQSALNPSIPVIRRQWTPVKNTTLSVDSPSPLMGGEVRKSKRSAFDDMVGVMRYTTNSRQSSQEALVGKEDVIFANSLRNKRPLEIIGLPSTAMIAKEKPIKLSKQKQPKKKAKTITEHATAPFREPVDSPILAYFEINESEETDPKKVSRKRGSPAMKKRKPSPEVVVLLSPTSARERFDSQEFVFGTSSQLEKIGDNKGTHDSQLQIGFDDQDDDYNLPPPSTSVSRRGFLKSLAKERKGGSIFRGNAGSNNIRYDESGVKMTTSRVREQPHQNALEGRSQLGKMRQTASGLWDAAARDHDGELMSAEVVDMTGIDNSRPESERGGWNEVRTVRELPGDENVTTGSNPTGRPVSQNDPLDSCHGPHREPLLIQHESSGIQMIESSTETPHIAISSSRGVTASLERSTKSAGGMTPTASVRTKTERSTGCEKMKLLPPMPDFLSHSTARLKLDVAKCGYKDMKTRGKMVSCLETSWEAKNKAATAQLMPQQLEANAGLVQNTAELSERGLSGEEAALVLQDAVSTEVVAKGGRNTRKPKRKTASKSKKPSKISSHDSGEPVSVNPLASDVHRLISEAVQESGRLHSEFSFYHAILMYDPIILGDMTLWLNGKEEFKGLGVDEEVVKVWCESKGICCARSETQAGKERTRK